MSRRYGDPIEVRRRDEDPSEFIWRGRLYQVTGVLARWVETGSWWTAAAASGSAALALDSAALDSMALAAEREVWRVEARAGQFAECGVYDLTFDWAATSGSGWLLRRVMD